MKKIRKNQKKNIFCCKQKKNAKQSHIFLLPRKEKNVGKFKQNIFSWCRKWKRKLSLQIILTFSLKKQNFSLEIGLNFLYLFFFKNTRKHYHI